MSEEEGKEKERVISKRYTEFVDSIGKQVNVDMGIANHKNLVLYCLKFFFRLKILIMQTLQVFGERGTFSRQIEVILGKSMGKYSS